MNAGGYTIIATPKVSPFTVITPESKLGGADYPFLVNFSDWMIVSSPLELSDEDMVQHPLARMELDQVMLPEATLEWVKDNKVVSLYIDRMDSETFLAQVGLEITLGDGLG